MSFQDKNRLSGFLNIEETEHSGSFCRRYFMLDMANRKLAYYMDSPMSLPESWKNPVGEIYLQYINKVADAKNIRPKLSFCFVISVAGRQYFLQADNDHVMNCWIDALNRASKISVQSTEQAGRGTEWHATDLSHTSYVTEIAGGVVCKMPVQVSDDSDSGSEDDEAQSSFMGKISPAGSLSRHQVQGQEHAADLQKSVKRLTGIKSGYAVKQGGVRKNWKRRYFVLDESCLSYFKTEQDKQPLKTVLITDILEACQAHGTNLNRDNLFEIQTNKRIFYVQCDTPAEMQSWILEIKAAVQRRKAGNKSVQDAGSKIETMDEDTLNYPKSVWV